MRICISRRHDVLVGLLLPGLLVAGCARTASTVPGAGSGHRSPANGTVIPAALVLPETPWRLLGSEGDAPARRQVDLTQLWILGRWTTFERRSGSVEGTGEFEFRREGAELKWQMVRTGWFSGVQTTQIASGSVRSISESAVELRGKYESSNLGNVAGRPVEHSFTRSGNTLRGYEAASDGTQSLLSLRRAP